MKKIISLVLSVCIILSACPVFALSRVSPYVVVGQYSFSDLAIVGAWGYVAEKNNGVKIIDVSTPHKPKDYKNIYFDEPIYNVEVSGSYMYAIGNTAIYVCDISNHDNPISKGNLKIAAGEVKRSNIFGDKLAVFGSKRTYLIDVSTPDSISKIDYVDNATLSGFYDGTYLYSVVNKNIRIHELNSDGKLSTVSDTPVTGLSACTDICVLNNTAYFANGDSTNPKIYVADITDKSSPVIKQEIEITERPRSIDIHNNRMYVGCYDDVLNVYDVSNPTTIKYMEQYRCAGVNTAVVATDRYAYICSSSRFCVFDSEYSYEGEPVPEIPSQESLGIEKLASFIDDNKYDISDNKKSENYEIEYDSSNVAAEVSGTWEAPPVIYSVTDSVKKNELVTFYGEGLTDGCSVYFQETSRDKCAKSSDAVKAQVIGYDENEQMVTVIVPSDVAGNTFTAFVENNFGISEAIPINNAVIQWVDRDRAVQGSTIRILGENLDAREFDGELATTVALVPEDGSSTVYPEIVSINPFCVEIKITDDMPLGTYKAYVTNDGVRWNSINYQKTLNDKYSKVDIIQKNDPYDTGIPWADKYKWDNKKNITDYINDYFVEAFTGEKYNIQNAIDDVASDGGGIVYFPIGTYKFRQIELPSNVVLMGEDMDETILLFSPSKTTTYAIKSKGDAGCYGFYNLTIKQDETKYGHADIYIDLGTRGDDISNFSEQYIFMKRVRMHTSMEQKGKRGFGCLIAAKSHVWFEDNIFYGIDCGPTSSYVQNYMYFINNRIISAAGNISIHGSRGVYERNVIEHCWWLVDVQRNAQGFLVKGPSYLTENLIRETGPGRGTDGELVLSEAYPIRTKMSGKIISASANTAVLAPITTTSDTWQDIRKHGDGWDIIITQGRGIGQRRTIKAFDQTSQSVTLYDDWDILPDNSSRFAISVYTEGMNVYNNYAETAGKGWWMYNTCYNSNVVNNFSANTDGGMMYGNMTESNGVAGISYFNRMDGNVSEGYSNSGYTNGIGLFVKTQEKDPDEVCAAYGNTLRRNVVRGIGDTPKYTKGSEAPDVNGIYILYSADVEQTKTTKILRGCIVEDNRVDNLDTGITVGAYISPMLDKDGTVGAMSSNVFVRGNDFVSVDREIIDLRNEAITDIQIIKDSVSNIINISGKLDDVSGITNAILYTGDELTLNNIRYIEQLEPDEWGWYNLKIICDEPADDLTLKIVNNGVQKDYTVEKAEITQTKLTALSNLYRDHEENLYARAIFSNPFNENRTYQIIVAYYDKDGRLIDCVLGDSGVVQYGDSIITAKLNEPEKYHSVSAYLWESMDKPIPLSKNAVKISY